MQGNQNYIKYLFWSQCYKIRNKLQEQNSKKHKHLVAKQYATKQLVDHLKKEKKKKKKLKKKKKKKPSDNRKWKHNSPKLMGCSKSSSKRELYSNTILPQETRKIST